MYHYIIYSFCFVGFLSVNSGSLFSADDHKKGVHPSTSLVSKHGRDDEEEGQRKRPRVDTGSAAASIQEDDDNDEENKEEARSFADLAGEQIYANPIFDAASKYLFTDDVVRIGFMKTFTGNPHIISTEILDTSLNPLRTLTQARAFLNDDKNVEFMNKIREEKDAEHIAVKVQSEGEEEVIRDGGSFLVGLSNIFGDLKKKFPLLERHSQLDVVCRLDNGEFILVEVQVKPQDFWDKRALYYAAGFYGNQLKRGGKWDDLKKVIAINLLGGESKHWRDVPVELVRHYKFIDTVAGHAHEIDSLQLIQYNLLSPQIEGLTQVELKEWLQFWKSAHHRKPDELAGVTTAAVRSAYERVRVAGMPADVRAGYEAEVADYLRYSQNMHHERAEARKDGVEEGAHKAMLIAAIKMFRKGGAYTPEIMEFTGITEEQTKEAIAKEQD